MADEGKSTHVWKSIADLQEPFNDAVNYRTGKYFSSQQTGQVQAIEAADQYFQAEDDNSIFRRLLRSTFQKPRDVLTFIRIARTVSIRRLGRGASTRFEPDIVRNPDYTKEYSDYLLGEVRDYANFYMKQEDFFLYIKFFQYLNGKGEFTFKEFSAAYGQFKGWISGESIRATEYLRDAEALLQFFFDVNIIGYRESVGDDQERQERFVHFSFRERTLTNIAPKVKTTALLVVNPGVAKSLDIGLKSKQKPASTDSRRRASRNSGTRQGLVTGSGAGRTKNKASGKRQGGAGRPAEPSQTRSAHSTGPGKSSGKQRQFRGKKGNSGPAV
jgi:hypothetical protein